MANFPRERISFLSFCEILAGVCEFCSFVTHGQKPDSQKFATAVTQ